MEIEQMEMKIGETPQPKKPHQSKLEPKENKFHKGNGEDGKHYWLVPPEVYDPLNKEFGFTFGHSTADC